MGWTPSRLFLAMGYEIIAAQTTSGIGRTTNTGDNIIVLQKSMNDWSGDIPWFVHDHQWTGRTSGETALEGQLRVSSCLQIDTGASYYRSTAVHIDFVLFFLWSFCPGSLGKHIGISIL